MMAFGMGSQAFGLPLLVGGDMPQRGAAQMLSQ